MDDKNKDILYGGQAVIEGVMMRSPREFAVACRKPDGGIEVRHEEVKSIWGRGRMLKIPLVRGVFVLIDALHLGIKALMFSANLALAEEQKKNPKKNPKPSRESKTRGQRINDIAIGVTLPIGLLMGVLLFVVLPNVAAGFLKKPLGDERVLLNLGEGLIRIVIFVLYIMFISLMPDIRRVFMYHGAEHKAINMFENGEELTPENARRSTTRHVRCGTSFIVLVLIISIFAFSFFGWDNWAERILSRLVVLPLVAGIAYEIVRFVGRRRDSRWARALVVPGLWFQRLTTREPTDDMVEVAVTALHEVIEPQDQPAPAGQPATT
jgi:uncharacterized protein YqhQ